MLEEKSRDQSLWIPCNLSIALAHSFAGRMVFGFDQPSATLLEACRIKVGWELDHDHQAKWWRWLPLEPTCFQIHGKNVNIYVFLKFKLPFRVFFYRKKVKCFWHTIIKNIWEKKWNILKSVSIYLYRHRAWLQRHSMSELKEAVRELLQWIIMGLSYKNVYYQ